MEIGERIRSERKRLGLTLQQVARKSGISKMTLHRIETGKSSPSIACLGDIAEVLQRPLASFIEEDRGFVKIIKKKEQFLFANNNIKARMIFPRGSLSAAKGNIAINYVEAKDGAEVDTHMNKGFEWVFQISGKSEFYYDNKKHVADAGDVFFYDGRRPHSVRYYGKNSFLLISFK